MEDAPYMKLRKAVAQLSCLDSSHEMFIDAKTADAADRTLRVLGAIGTPPPKLFVNGEDALVLT